ncbi:hypothetical protein C3V43_00475 [Bacteroides heparinolyticus]|uniref:hypothetical protein n=1 Tax=Prevotella heparinolytica TaxID=28113 RepID=UPI000D023EBB|nr:hypothetical protein [Bacteroides heparinolyticus]AVM56420.1 hypothetical protein C3V43_00475 [Bacteroides heparinolyticus]
MKVEIPNSPIGIKVLLSKIIGVKKYKFPYALQTTLAGLFLICWILAFLNLLGISFKSSKKTAYHINKKNTTTSLITPQSIPIKKERIEEKEIEKIEKTEIRIENKENKKQYQEIVTWQGNNIYGNYCSYTLQENVTDGTFKLKENNTNTTFECTKYTIRKATEYYLFDPDIADINTNLACFNLKKGTSIYIIHNFDYDSVQQESMDGILVIFSRNNARIYLDILINGTAYYCNNGNPPISRLNKNGVLEHYNHDGSNEPAYECYAKLH